MVVAHGHAALAGLVAAGGFLLATALTARGRTIPVGRLAELGVTARQAGAVVDRPGTPRSGPAGMSGLSLAQRWMACSRADARHMSIALVGTGLVASLGSGSLAPALAGVAVLIIGSRVRAARRRRADLEFDAALPGLVDGMTAALRAGATSRVALIEGAAGAPAVVNADVEVIATRLERGERLADAMAWWARHRRRPQLDVLAAVMATSAEFGGPLANVLASVAEQMRDDLRSRDEVRTQSAQAVASAGMLVLLPPVSVAISAIADPGVVVFLFATPLGALCLGVGVTLEFLGAWWMSSIVRGVQ